MGSLMAILFIMACVQAILGLWLLIKAWELSSGWFLYLIFLGVGGRVLLPHMLGPILSWVIPLGAALLFVVKYWDEVRTPFLLLVAVSVLHTVVVVQAERTLAQQQTQALTEQAH